jgi:hypothetical protein
MADVAVDRADGRGQMILVAAFGVAVMLVALALILNTAIYTENRATRGSDITGGKDAIQYRNTLDRTANGIVENVNYHNNSTADARSSYDPLNEQVRWAVWNFSNMSGRQQALDGVVTNVTIEDQNEGTRVYNNSGNFSDDEGTRNWTVVENTDDVRAFTVDADAESLKESDPPPVFSDSFFYVNFSDRDDNEFYRVFIFNDSTVGVDGRLNVTVEGQTDEGWTFKRGCERQFNDGRADVNITGATAEGERCRPLEHVANVTSDPFTIRFNNTNDGGATNTIEGNYTMVVDSDFTSTESAAPSRTRAVYATTIHVVYESDRLYFETDVRAAPGEYDD